MHRTPFTVRSSNWALIPMLALALLAGCGKTDAPAAEEKVERHEEGSQIELSPEEARRAGLQVEALQAQTQAGIVTVTATIRANQDRFAHIAPRVEGRLSRVTANLGDRVRAGQVLAVLDSVALGEAQSAYQQAAASHRVAQADHERAKSLAAEEIVPQRELLRARADLDRANAELHAATDKLRLLGASPQAGATFELRSPLAGTVIEKKATLGELGGPGESLFTVADLSRVWIEGHLTEDVLGKVRLGAPASVTVGAYPGVRFAGQVTFISGVLDKETRTAVARIEVDNPDGRLKPGMFAGAAIESGKAQGQVLSVPDEAVVLLQGQPTVFVQDKAGFVPRPVQTGDKSGGRTVIRSGVQAGEQVVTAGAYALKARLLKSQISDEH